MAEFTQKEMIAKTRAERRQRNELEKEKNGAKRIQEDFGLSAGATTNKNEKKKDTPPASKTTHRRSQRLSLQGASQTFTPPKVMTVRTFL